MGLFPAVWIAILIAAIVVQLWAHRSTTLWSLGVRSRLGRRLLFAAIALMVGEVAYRFGPVAIGPIALALIGIAYWSPERRRTSSRARSARMPRPPMGSRRCCSTPCASTAG